MYPPKQNLVKNKTVTEAREAKQARDDFWSRLDSQLLADEAELEREKTWLSDAREEALSEFDAHLHTMSPEDRQMALDGLRAYKKEVLGSSF